MKSSVRPPSFSIERALVTASIALVALLVAAPIVAVVASLAEPPGDTQQHVWSTVGWRYVGGTLALCAIVGVASTIIGAGGALVISLARFPGRDVLGLALALPLATPAYLAAYAYADLLGPFGALRGALTGVGLHAPDIKSLWGAGFILTMTTYPYVYLAMRASLAQRSSALLETARSLGRGPAAAAMTTVLPAGRAALAGGLALVLMETSADFGVADFFGVQTLSTGIFRTWHGLGDLNAAAQLASGLFAVAIVLMLLEEFGRRGQASESARSMRGAHQLLQLRGVAAVATPLALWLPVILGFAAPLGVFAEKSVSAGAWRPSAEAFLASMGVGGAGAALAIMLALMIAGGGGRGFLVRTATVGYALPGAVVAIGVLAVSGLVVQSLGANGWMARSSGVTAISGLVALIYAYVVRFETAAYNAAAAGFAQVSPRMREAARNLGASPQTIMARIRLPLAAPSIAAGGLIVFTDILKELPATLILRPFNFETLATRVYRLASDERLAEAAPEALVLMASGFVSVVLLAFLGNGVRRRQAR